MTPTMRIYPEVLQAQIDRVRKQTGFEVAYSVKTNPDPVLVGHAAQSRALIEVISQEERELALRCGAPSNRIIMNGPAKWLGAPKKLIVGGLFVDSIPEFDLIEDYLNDGNILDTEFIGVRLSKSRLSSRFGIDVDNRDELADAMSRLRQLMVRLIVPWALHFHIAESVTGPDLWSSYAASILRAGYSLAELLGSPAVVDFGGGWHTTDLDLLSEATPSVTTGARKILELGKSILEPTAELLTSVIVGPNRDGDVVVDAGISDAPEAIFWPHPSSLREGEGRVLGRTCMEHDVLLQDVDTADLEVGDVITLQRVGGYDSSMSYDFGRGQC